MIRAEAILFSFHVHSIVVVVYIAVFHHHATHMCIDPLVRLTFADLASQAAPENVRRLAAAAAASMTNRSSHLQLAQVASKVLSSTASSATSTLIVFCCLCMLMYA